MVIIFLTRIKTIYFVINLLLIVFNLIKPQINISLDIVHKVSKFFILGDNRSKAQWHIQ